MDAKVVEVVAGGQRVMVPRRMVATWEDAVTAAITFALEGRLEPTLSWTQSSAEAAGVEPAPHRGGLG